MKRTLCVLSLVVFFAMPLSAGITFQTGNNPPADFLTAFNVVFADSCVGCVDGPGYLVVGHLQTRDTLVALRTTSKLTAIGDADNTLQTSNGDGFRELKIEVPGYWFHSIIFQLTELPTVPDGSIQFFAESVSYDGFASTQFVIPNPGGQYFTITSNGNPRIAFVNILTSQPLHDISNIRVGGIAPIPEPAASVLLGAGIIALCLLKRR